MSEKVFRQAYADLSRCTEKWRTWYVLVDPVLSDLPAQYLTGTAPTPLPVSHPELRTGLRPYLLPLGEPGRDPRVEVIVKQAVSEALRQGPEKDGRRSICGWIFSNLSSQTLAAWLARHASVVADGKRRIFRVWDPRTLDLLTLLLDAQQQNTLAGSIGDWRWLTRSGAINCFPTAEETAVESLDLRQEQLEMLLNSEAIHQVLTVLQDLGRDASSESVGHGVLTAVRRGVARWRLTEKADLVDFALYAILVHAQFDADDEVQSAMQKAASEGRSAVHSLAGFTDEYWLQVRKRAATVDNTELLRRREVASHG